MLNQKLIFKNTLFLYTRTLLNLLIGLYSARVILRVLGFENYGIFNLISGTVTMFTVLNTSMFSATQKFITCAQADSTISQRTVVFSSCVWIHVLIALLFFMVAEVFGIFYLLPELSIPDARRGVAEFCFHCMILVTILKIVQVPLDVSIVAHENIGFYAYMGMADVLVKLGVVILLQFLPGDKLRIYTQMFIVIAAMTLAINWLFCRRYPECRILFRFDRQLLKKMGAFFGWRTLGGTSQMLETQGNSIVINIFHGVLLNATLGVANQVGNLFYSLAQNFQTAFVPQIMKTYAAVQYDELWELVHNSARISIALLCFVGGPLLLNTDFVLTTWLDEVPPDAALFVRGFVIYWILESISAPLWMTILATGKIMWYQIILSSITLSFVLFFWISQKLGGSASYLIFLRITMSASIILFRTILLNRMLNFQIRNFLFGTCGHLFLIAFVSITIAFFSHRLLAPIHPFVRFVCVSSIYEILFLGLLFAFVLSKAEKDGLIAYLKRKIGRNATC